ncbi:MAG TPA: site-2 protease family protein [Candidatus Saccharimonadales bacterium]|nr:site-2 protease family protein [Candidatus Saccharimonadales bacterium]
MIGNLTLSDVILVIIVLLVSMSIHEAMHAYAGHALGDTTAQEEGRLSLNPLRHIDPFMTVLLPAATLLLFGFPVLAAKPVPFNPYRVRYGEYGAALIALAGPLSNFVLAFLSAWALHYTVAGTLLDRGLQWGVELNVVLFVFNLIPIPPLDGSRVLYAFAPESLQRIMAQIEPFGIFVVFALVLVTNGQFLVGLYNLVFQLLP